MSETKTVLVISPHPDDESIGCGGAIASHTQRGDRVVVAFLTSGELGLKHLPKEEAWAIREAEAQAAAVVLSIARIDFLRQPDWYLNLHITAAASHLKPLLDLEMPRRIYVPHAAEWHPDHQASLEILQRALADRSFSTPEILSYEVWTPLTVCDLVDDITCVWPHKLRAIRCYGSQLRHFRYDRAIQGLNRYRGELGAHCRYGEAFHYEAVQASQEDTACA
jgi:LmbE family N-acetylglucosaminyl deacetylase